MAILEEQEDYDVFRFSGHTIGTEATGYSLVISVAHFESIEDAEAFYTRVRNILELDLNLDGSELPN